MESPKIALIHQYITAYNSFDTEGMCACLHPEIRFENWSGGELTLVTEGLDAFRAQAESARQYFTSRRQVLTQIEESAAEVRVSIAYTATLAQSLPNGMSAGDILSLQGTSIFQFREGLIVGLSDHS